MAMHISEKVENILNKLDPMYARNFSEGNAANLRVLTQAYLNIVAEDEILDRDVLDIYGMIVSYWQFMQTHQPDEVKVKVYNPSFEQHGWTSSHTVIEALNDDKPFLVDTLLLALNKMDLGVHFMMYVGGAQARRDKQHKLQELYGADDDSAPEQVRPESLIICEIDRQKNDTQVLNEIREQLAEVFSFVKAVVSDFPAMQDKLQECIDATNSDKAPKSADLGEVTSFLEWVKDDHFIFLGYCELKNDARSQEQHTLSLKPQTTLGLLAKNRNYLSLNYHDFAQRLGNVADSQPLLTVAKSDHISPIHRASTMDIIGVLQYDDKGNITGEKRFLGLYTSEAYHVTPEEIPFLRKKVQRVIERSGFRKNGHSYKTLKNILETYPRDELFLTDEDELFETCIGILHIKERQKTKLFIRQDSYSRYYFCMLFMPRERYNSDIRGRIQQLLKERLGGYEVSFTANFLESVLCRIDFVVKTDPTQSLPPFDISVIEEKIHEAGRKWTDDLLDALVYEHGERQGQLYYAEYRNAFPPAYTHDFVARMAVYDIMHFETLKTGTVNQSMALYNVIEEPENRVRFKLFVKDQNIALSNVLPILENMGMYVVEERPYRITPASGGFIWVSDFGLQVDENFDMESAKELFQDAFANIWNGVAENDRFNYLITYSQLGWREVALIRAYARYIIQMGARFATSYITETFSSNPQVVRQLIELFYKRFDPSLKESVAQRNKKQQKLIKQIEANLVNITNIEQDKILHMMLSAIMATIRTNFFQCDQHGCYKEYVSFKLMPEDIPGIPKPVPRYEIFVYSKRVEGIHMRFSKVARGGLRWSDRPSDFRTEVLGLVKAQQVKNAVIVPMGAKGGFVPKQLPATGDRESIQNEGIACYRIFISAMLELTDNYVSGKIVPPDHTVRYDEDDPYLVVAADKGTATFSDIANDLAADKGFWMGDAFASGGSNGYDHKKMAITARGAWESVKTHFKQLGLDTQSEEFTVIGVGDMQGDVFGNGMLLSRHIRLVAAFNHMHIFIDPNPDAGAGYKERKRLFDMDRSTWDDYDRKLISKGGGVFSRGAKSITLTPEIQQLLGTDENTLEPNVLIHRLLKLQVDLFWNGGVGTYVKASTESHADVGDRANDELRVNGNELGCRVVGEGGNLGLTQLGRVEFALNGGAINTDAIDNSGGVDCSDHEVNIKILLNATVEKGKLDVNGRNELLASMEEEVGDMVLVNNYYQNQTLSSTVKNGAAAVETFSRLMRELERKTVFNREIEFLPTDKQLWSRVVAGKGITSPELSVLMAYTKALIKEKVLESDLPDDPYFFKYLKKEFPTVLNEQFEDIMRSHRLAREIIATQVTNALCMYTGVTFVQRLLDETGSSIAEIVKAFAVVAEVFRLDRMWERIEELDGTVSISTQHKMHNIIAAKVRRMTRWLLRNNRSGIEVKPMIDYYQPLVANLGQKLRGALNDNTVTKMNDQINALVEANVPENLAKLVVFINLSSPVMDIISIASTEQMADSELMVGFFILGDRLSLVWFKETLRTIGQDSYWGQLTASALRDDVDRLQCDLVAFIHSYKQENENFAQAFERWLENYEGMVSRWESIIEDLKSDTPKFVSAHVAFRALLDMVQMCRHQASGYCVTALPFHNQ